MKTLYLIGGTMGVGKTTISRQLKKDLHNSVFLDGDWCWDADPFQVTEETKEMVMHNICFLLNNFLRCTAYDNIILCWVMHEQYIIDSIINELDTSACRVIKISLMTDETNLKKQGMLALTFVDKADYDKIREHDLLSVSGLVHFAPGRNLTIILHHEDGTKESFEVQHTYNEQQIAWFRAGSALNAR